MSKKIINNWIDNLHPSSFIDRQYKRYIPSEILNEQPLIPYEEEKWHKLFIKPPNADYSKLQLTATGVYSIGQPDLSAELIKYIKINAEYANLNINELTITETNGGLGGFSIALANEFKNINIIELNPTHFSIINNNLHIYEYDKPNSATINMYNNDYLDVMLDINQDIIISDPPWGGKNFINQKALRLGFSNIDITDVINFLAAHNKFKLYIFLAPLNFDFNSFTRKIRATNINIQKIRRHNYICIRL